MGLHRPVGGSPCFRKRLAVYQQGTQTLRKEQRGGTGKARPEQGLFYVPGVEADKLQDNAHIKNAENNQQRPHGLSSENRRAGAD